MLAAQPGIFAQGTRSHHYLEFDMKSDASMPEIRARIASLRGPRVTGGGVNLLIGIGPDLMRRLAPGATPDELAPFAPINGDGRGAPATQRDVWLWLHGAGPDVVLDGAVAATVVLGPTFTMAT